MVKTISELKAQSAEVKNASAIGENTATRVGQLFGDIVEHVEQYENTKDGKDASQDAQMQSLVSAEESRAKGEERGLQNQIHAEKIDRQTADTYLGNLIQQEISTRAEADENIRTALANETARAQAAEQELAAAQIYTSKIKDGAVTTPKIADGAVTYEKTDIIAQELGTNMTKVPSQKVVTDAIQKEETERKADIDGLTVALGSETIHREQADKAEESRAKGEERGLQNQIHAEEIDRKTADTYLGNLIQQETERAMAAEQANATAIDSVVDKDKEQDQKLSELDKKIPLKETDEEGFYLTNEVGDVIATYKDGKWIFASTIEEISLDNIIAAIQNLNQSFEHFDVLKETEEDGFAISNEYGEVVAKYINDKWYFGEIDSKTTNDIIKSIQNNLVSIEESGFAVCNEYGEVIAKYNNVWNFSGTSIGKKKNGCVNISHIDMNIGTKVILLGSNSVQNNKSFTFSGVINGTFNDISLGHGYKGYFLASWIDVTSTDIVVHNYTSTESVYTYPHGLTIENNIQVIITIGYKDKKIKIVSNGYSFEQDITRKYFGAALDVWVKSSSELKDCSMSWACPKLQNGVWIFGDSYYTLGDTKRWVTHLFNDGFINSIVVAHSGETDFGGLISLNNLLKIATPRCIVWGLGMNDHDISATEYNLNWKNVIDRVIAICKKKGIDLILATIPSAKQNSSTEGAAAGDAIHEAKNAHIKTLGIRYIDFAKAVGATSEGIWYDGMKEDTGVHPTEKGAIALYMQAVADAPEIMI